MVRSVGIPCGLIQRLWRSTSSSAFDWWPRIPRTLLLPDNGASILRLQNIDGLILAFNVFRLSCKCTKSEENSEESLPHNQIWRNSLLYSESEQSCDNTYINNSYTEILVILFDLYIISTFADSISFLISFILLWKTHFHQMCSIFIYFHNHY